MDCLPQDPSLTPIASGVMTELAAERRAPFGLDREQLREIRVLKILYEIRHAEMAEIDDGHDVAALSGWLMAVLGIAPTLLGLGVTLESQALIDAGAWAASSNGIMRSETANTSGVSVRIAESESITVVRINAALPVTIS